MFFLCFIAEDFLWLTGMEDAYELARRLCNNTSYCNIASVLPLNIKINSHRLFLISWLYDSHISARNTQETCLITML